MRPYHRYHPFDRKRALLALAIGFLFTSWLPFEAVHCLTPESVMAMAGKSRSLDDFFSVVDRDGDGEIEQHEASKFLEMMGEVEAPEEGDSKEDEASIGELLALHNINFNFSYGGNTISASELTDHLRDMLTQDRVVDWVIHGLRLPQYADTFEGNAIDGLDFPALIADNGDAIEKDLGVASPLHRSKIHKALLRQIFGIGRVPGPPQQLTCQVDDTCRGIQLQWDPPDNLGAPPVHKYLVQRRTRPTAWVVVGDPKDDAFLDQGTGLQPGGSHMYRVQAWGGHGPSEWVTIEGCMAPSPSATCPSAAAATLSPGSEDTKVGLSESPLGAAADEAAAAVVKGQGATPVASPVAAPGADGGKEGGHGEDRHGRHHEWSMWMQVAVACFVLLAKQGYMPRLAVRTFRRVSSPVLARIKTKYAISRASPYACCRWFARLTEAVVFLVLLAQAMLRKTRGVLEEEEPPPSGAAPAAALPVGSGVPVPGVSFLRSGPLAAAATLLPLPHSSHQPEHSATSRRWADGAFSNSAEHTWEEMVAAMTKGALQLEDGAELADGAGGNGGPLGSVPEGELPRAPTPRSFGKSASAYPSEAGGGLKHPPSAAFVDDLSALLAHANASGAGGASYKAATDGAAAGSSAVDSADARHVDSLERLLRPDDPKVCEKVAILAELRRGVSSSSPSSFGGGPDPAALPSLAHLAATCGSSSVDGSAGALATEEPLSTSERLREASALPYSAAALNGASTAPSGGKSSLSESESDEMAEVEEEAEGEGLHDDGRREYAREYSGGSSGSSNGGSGRGGRYRCNQEGCRSRFDRWHTISDWRASLSKHFCRDCQGVYCVKHTRISPHGSRGQCGLDSKCLCYACFARLPPEAREKMERINKLRAGPPVLLTPSSSSAGAAADEGASPREGEAHHHARDASPRALERDKRRPLGLPLPGAGLLFGLSGKAMTPPHRSPEHEHGREREREQRVMPSSKSFANHESASMAGHAARDASVVYRKSQSAGPFPHNIGLAEGQLSHHEPPLQQQQLDHEPHHEQQQQLEQLQQHVRMSPPHSGGGNTLAEHSGHVENGDDVQIRPGVRMGEHSSSPRRGHVSLASPPVPSSISAEFAFPTSKSLGSDRLEGESLRDYLKAEGGGWGAGSHAHPLPGHGVGASPPPGGQLPAATVGMGMAAAPAAGVRETLGSMRVERDHGGVQPERRAAMDRLGAGIGTGFARPVVSSLLSGKESVAGVAEADNVH